MDVADTTPAAPRKRIVFLRSEIKSPPFTLAGRIAAGRALGSLQEGRTIAMPTSRPMPSIGPRCHELRIRDENHYWRIVYRIDPVVILVVAVFPKATRKTPKSAIALCQARLARFDAP